MQKGFPQAQCMKKLSLRHSFSLITTLSQHDEGRSEISHDFCHIHNTSGCHEVMELPLFMPRDAHSSA